jgi:hypothetical protein
MRSACCCKKQTCVHRNRAATHLRPWTTFLPLLLVLGIAMLKEAIEDYKRYRQDVEVNKRGVEVFDSGERKFVVRTWADLCVGDVIIARKVRAAGCAGGQLQGGGLLSFIFWQK